MDRASLGLIVSAAGLMVSLVPTLVYLVLISNGIVVDVGSSTFPPHLITAIVGVPITVIGLFLFRRGLRERLVLLQSGISTGPRVSTATRRVEVERGKPQGGTRPQFNEAGERSSVMSVSVKEDWLEGLSEIEDSSTLGGGDVSLPSSSVASSTTAESSAARAPITVKVRSSEIVCESCGNPAPIGAKICPHCGFKFKMASDPSLGCPVCGGSLDNATQVEGDLYVCGLCFSELVIPLDFLPHKTIDNS